MKLIYNEWCIPLKDYFQTINKDEKNFEYYLPFFISVIITITYCYFGNIITAFLKLRDLYPTTLAILIGFSITCITILISSNGTAIDLLKSTHSTGRILNGKEITLYQWLLLSFIYILIVQILVLICVFFFAYVLGMFKHNLIYAICVFILIYLLLHILFSLIRNISNLYFSFLNNV